MNCRTRSFKLGLLAIILILYTEQALAPVPGRAATASCVTFKEGNLIDEIRSIVAQMPGTGSNGMSIPSAAQMEAWEVLLDAVARGDLAAACDTIATHSFPYTIVHYTDTGSSNAEYWLIEENLPPSVGWGTYVIADEAETDLVIEVPHPGCEWKTEEEGVELLRQMRARAVLVAGTHRCANTDYSPCSGTTSFCGVEEPHRTSDVAHATQTIFFASHRALVVPGSDAVAVQLHGCVDCPDLFISNGTYAPGELAQELFRQSVSACAPLAVDLADCNPLDWPLAGTTNVEGRYSNGTGTLPGFDACTENAPGPSEPEQFLHLEQSRALRDDLGCLITALRRTFMDWHQTYVPVVLAHQMEARAPEMDVRAWHTVHPR